MSFTDSLERWWMAGWQRSDSTSEASAPPPAASAEGVGEEEDAAAAVDFIRARYPALPVWMTGFSFGARVGLTVGARREDVTRLLGVGLALSMFDYRFLEACPKPKAFIQAAEDEYGGRSAIEPAVGAMCEPKHLWVVDGADPPISGPTRRVRSGGAPGGRVLTRLRTLTNGPRMSARALASRPPALGRPRSD